MQQAVRTSSATPAAVSEAAAPFSVTDATASGTTAHTAGEQHACRSNKMHPDARSNTVT